MMFRRVTEKVTLLSSTPCKISTELHGAVSGSDTDNFKGGPCNGKSGGGCVGV